MMTQDEWASRLEQQLADHQETVSDTLWTDIETDVATRLRRRARIATLRRWAAAATIAAVVAGSSVVWWPSVPPEGVTTVEKETSHLAISNTARHHNAPSEQAAPTSSTPTLAREARRATPTSESVTGSANESGYLAESDTKDGQRGGWEVKNDPTPPETTASAKGHTEVPAPIAITNGKTSTKEITPSAKPTLALFTGGSVNSWRSYSPVRMSPQQEQRFAARAIYLAGYEERQQHDMPLSIGLTLSYPLTKRLSLSTGIVYTRLHSTFTYVMPSNVNVREQTLHYAGLPLSVHYRLLSYRGLQLYASAGGQADWNVKSTQATDGTDQDAPHDRLQWSLSGALGVQYNLLPQVGIYAEPGLCHYFDNGSNVRNIFKDHPTNFSLQLGIRLNLGSKK
jgi:hypothetical protein